MLTDHPLIVNPSTHKLRQKSLPTLHCREEHRVSDEEFAAISAESPLGSSQEFRQSDAAEFFEVFFFFAFAFLRVTCTKSYRS